MKSIVVRVEPLGNTPESRFGRGASVGGGAESFRAGGEPMAGWDELAGGRGESIYSQGASYDEGRKYWTQG